MSESVYLWEDGFWCYGFEFDTWSGRGADFRVVMFGTDEWMDLTGKQLV